MLNYSITDLKNSVIASMHGTTIRQVQNFNGLINICASQFLLDYDPPETKQYEQMTPIYGSSYDYAVPVDLKGDKVIDIFPQVARDYGNNFTQNHNRRFDRTKSLLGNTFTIKFDQFVKTIRVNYGYANPITVVDTTNSLSDNGTWVGSDTVENLITSNQVVADAQTSISFDVDTTGTLTNSTIVNPINLGAEYIKGSFFCWFYFEDASKVTTVTLKAGLSSADYASMTTSVTSSGTAFQNGWNQLRFDMYSATITGAITENIILDESGEIVEDEGSGFVKDESDYNVFNVKYLQFTFTGTAKMYINMSTLTFNLKSYLEIEYYSRFLFRSVGGAFKELATLDTDRINLDSDSFHAFTYLVRMHIARQQAGADSMFDYTTYEKDYQQQLAKLRSMYKSEIIPVQDVYYKKPNLSYRRINKYNI